MAEAKLIISADAKKAIKSLGELESAGRDLAKTFDSSFKFLAGLGGVIAGAFAFGKIASGIKTLTDASAESENAIQGLNTALALSGEFSVEASQGFQDFAAQIQQTTTVSEEAVLEQVKLAKSFGLTNEQARKTVDAAIDLSAATGDSLDGATTQLAKTFSGTLSAELKKSQQGFNKLSEEALKAGGALDVAKKAFGGTAEAQANTFSGAIIKLSAAFGEIQETLGAVITSSPAVIAGIDVLKESFVTLNKTLVEGDGAKKLFDTFLQIASVVIPAIATAIGFLAKAFVGFFTLIEKSALGINKLITEVQILTGALSESQGQNILTSLQKNSDETIKGYEDLYNTINDVQGIAETLATTLSKNAKGSGQSLASFIDMSKAAAKAKTEAEKLLAVTKEQEEVLKVLVGETEKYALDLRNTGVDQGKIIENNLNFALKAIDAKREELKSQNKLNDAIEDQLKLQKRLLSGKAQEDFKNQKPTEAEANATPLTVSVEPDKSLWAKAFEDVDFGKLGLEIAGGFKAVFDAFTSSVSFVFNDILGGGLFNDIASIPEQIAAFPQILVDALGQFLEEGANIAQVVVEGFAKALDILITNLPDIFASFIDGFIGLLDKLISRLPELLVSIVNGIGDLLIAVFEESIPKLLNALPEIVQGIVDAMPRIIKALLAALPNIVTTIFKILPQIIKTLVEGLIEGIVILLDNLEPIIEALVAGLVEAIPLIVDTLIDVLIVRGGLLRIMISFFKLLYIGLPRAFYNGLLTAFQNLGTRIWQAPEWLKNLRFEKPQWVTDVQKFFSDLFSAKTLTNAFTGAWQAFYEGLIKVFTDIIQGIKDAVNPGKNAALGNAGSFLKAATGVTFIQGLAKGDPLTGINETIEGLNPFATGGMVPSGYPDDSFPARLTSGEFVADTALTQRLNEFLDNGGSTGGPIQIVLKVGEQELANIMYNLNRKGFRTA